MENFGPARGSTSGRARRRLLQLEQQQGAVANVRHPPLSGRTQLTWASWLQEQEQGKRGGSFGRVALVVSLAALCRRAQQSVQLAIGPASSTMQPQRRPAPLSFWCHTLSARRSHGELGARLQGELTRSSVHLSPLHQNRAQTSLDARMGMDNSPAPSA